MEVAKRGITIYYIMCSVVDLHNESHNITTEYYTKKRYEQFSHFINIKHFISLVTLRCEISTFAFLDTNLIHAVVKQSGEY